MNENKQQAYTIGEWADIWFDVYAAEDLQPESIAAYQYARKRVDDNFPEIERLSLQELTPMLFQRVLNNLKVQYARETLKHIRAFYNNIYLAAVENGICIFNPIRETRIPKGARFTIVSALTREERTKLDCALSCLPVQRNFLLRFCLHTGLRSAELRNFKWCDWNKNKREITVTKSKTKNGLRTIPILPEASFILCHLRYIEKNSCCKSEYVFHNPDGSPITKGQLRYTCEKAAKIAGIKHLNPHMLRHTFATDLVEKKVSIKVIAEILGHADMYFTLKTYVTLEKGFIREELDKASDIKKGNRQNKKELKNFEFFN